MCAGGGDGAETVEIDRVMRGESRSSWTTLSSAAGQNERRFLPSPIGPGGSVAEWLACWTHAQKGPGSNRSRDAVG